LAVRIDGSKRPDAISDELAYRHFFKTIIVNKTATPKDIAVRDSLLSKVGLSQTDRTKLLEMIRDVKDQLDAIENERKGLTASDRNRLSALKGQRDRTLDDAVSAVLCSLQPDGRQLLERFVREHVKRRIVVYGDSKPLS
jgi:hypothetical protein